VASGGEQIYILLNNKTALNKNKIAGTEKSSQETSG